jgi:hypothetical protein
MLCPGGSKCRIGSSQMSADPRLDIIHAVQAVMAGDRRIDGLVVIGSGAVGFRDDLSDVDLIAAVASGLDPETVGDELARDLRSSLPLYRYIQTPPARALGIHVFLLDGHIELDLSFVSTAELRATTDRWRIVFDREGLVARQMSIPLPERPRLSERARFRYLAGCGSLWFGLKALQRNELLLATDRLGEVRSHVAALACLDNFGTDEQVAQQADTLPEASRIKLRSLVCHATAPELERAFGAAIAALSHYDRTLLQSKLDDGEYAGLAEWLSLKYAARSAS